MRRIIFALCAYSISITAAAAAPQSSRFSYEASYFPKAEDAGGAMEFVSASGVALDGKFSLWYLLGEPAINCTARWKNSDRASMVIDPLGDGSRLIEPAQENEIEIYNLLLAASGPDPRDTKYGNGSAKTIAVLCDAGIVAQNGRDGFNVAGSPNWNKFLCALPDAGVRFQGPDHRNKDHCRAMNGKWLSEAEAKAVANSGLKLEDVTALKASLNGAAVMKRAEKRNWRETSADFKRRRAAAYFETFRASEGESDWDAHYRKINAINSLPGLPIDNPSAEELRAYEEAWRALLAADTGSEAFAKDWRAKEKELVGEQLARMKMLDEAAAREEARFSQYLLALEALKDKAPENPDPMAAYRTDTPLVEFKDGSLCGFKDSAGNVVIPAGFEECYAEEGYGVYGVRSDYYHFPPQCGDRNCAIVFDQQGRVLVKASADKGGKKGGEVFISIYPQHGIVGFVIRGYSSRDQMTGKVWSLLENRFVHEVPNFRSDLISGYFSGVFVRRERLALAYMSGANCQGAGYVYGINYFYLDTKRVEESGLCTRPAKDPLNKKPEE